MGNYQAHVHVPQCGHISDSLSDEELDDDMHRRRLERIKASRTGGSVRETPKMKVAPQRKMSSDIDDDDKGHHEREGRRKVGDELNVD